MSWRRAAGRSSPLRAGRRISPLRAAGRSSPLRAGLLAIVVIAAGSYFAFVKDVPFTHGHEVEAIFEETSALTADSPVRIAGVAVGKVKRIEPLSEGSTASVVTMELEQSALPLHEDARLKIRPRIFLEGNFFVDLRPGTPSSPELGEGDTIPPAQTSAPVQIDQVLATFRSDAREDLRRLVRGYGDAIGGAPNGSAEDSDQDPATRGETAGRSLNDSLRDSAEALRGTAVTADALRGTELRDLSRLIAGGQRVARALADRERALQALVSSLDRTTSALAAEQRGLRRTVRRLPGALAAARPALGALHVALPQARAFAREVVPGLRETQATIDAALPWVDQARALVSPAELRGLVADLRPATPDLARFVGGTVRLLPQADLVNRCLTENVLPTGDVVIRDGRLTTGLESYRELFQSFVGLSGESQSFDGNGQYLRFGIPGGATTVRTGPLPEIGPLFANAVRPPLGTRPARPARRPPVRRREPCFAQRPPDLNGARTGGGP